LEFNEPAHVSLANAKQVAYLDRLLGRTEIATRISHMTPAYLTGVASKWFWDKETAVTGWGNLHSAIIGAHYNRTFKRATLGEYSQVGVHFCY
jgi:processing peptidase subunit beta